MTAEACLLYWLPYPPPAPPVAEIVVAPTTIEDVPPDVALAPASGTALAVVLARVPPSPPEPTVTVIDVTPSGIAIVPIAAPPPPPPPPAYW